MPTNREKLAIYDGVLLPLTIELQVAIAKLINDGANPTELLQIREKFLALRQKINNETNLGLKLMVRNWIIGTYSLTGDFENDGGQVNLSSAKNKPQN